jgi:hypothetical protein
MNDLKAKQKKLDKAKEVVGKDCVRNPDGTYIDSSYKRLECVERKRGALTTIRRLEKEIQALKSKSTRGRPPMECSKLDSKIRERKTEKGKKTMLKKCSNRSSHPKKPCVVKNNKCVSK